MHGHRSALDAGKVQQLLRHAQHALRFLVHNPCRTRLLGLALEAAVGQRLTETDEAGQRGLELVRDVGEKVALDAPGPLVGLGHPIERRSELADLVGAAYADPARVVSTCDVLRGRSQLSERPRQRPAD